MHPAIRLTGEDPAAAPSPGSKVGARPEDERVTIHGVSWQEYVAVREVLDHIPGLRMTYLYGSLEIMSPSYPHEEWKKRIAGLIEIYRLERDVDLTGAGSMTFKREARERGAEPDECYFLTHPPNLDRPDIAIEIVLTSGGIDKLAVHRGFHTPEVWFWRDMAFWIYCLSGEGYALCERSGLLPEIDFKELATFVLSPLSQTGAVRAYRDLLRSR
ncbi:MAG: Uma2 family endonuclease [Myxococcales bacterium]|nr:Uma2 family endonuclease [Myxococcales bacterium]